MQVVHVHGANAHGLLFVLIVLRHLLIIVIVLILIHAVLITVHAAPMHVRQAMWHAVLILIQAILLLIIIIRVPSHHRLQHPLLCCQTTFTPTASTLPLPLLLFFLLIRSTRGAPPASPRPLRRLLLRLGISRLGARGAARASSPRRRCPGNGLCFAGRRHGCTPSRGASPRTCTPTPAHATSACTLSYFSISIRRPGRLRSTLAACLRRGCLGCWCCTCPC
mmetsp:Transcript_7226/g.17435  ORF Transcript_7226/g.17435 Transcript_7226/m.17435 type:complete len:222 (+) Transcript_7226:3714-4379(+)